MLQNYLDSKENILYVLKIQDSNIQDNWFSDSKILSKNPNSFHPTVLVVPLFPTL